jgi:hypothetical protein
MGPSMNPSLKAGDGLSVIPYEDGNVLGTWLFSVLLMKIMMSSIVLFPLIHKA